MKKLAMFAMFVVLLAIAAVTYWVVKTRRPPGAMTVIESQAMDMSAMKAPEGVLPVAVETVKRESLSATVTYTGTVLAYGDEDVVARVQGRVLSIPVYPGQRVVPDQVVAELDSVELEARAAGSEAAARVGQAEGEAAMAEAEAAARAAEAAQAEARAASVQVAQARSEVRSAQANASFREKALARDRHLHREGGLALEELQRSQAETEEARTRLRNAQLAVREQHEEANAAARRAEIESARRLAALARGRGGRARSEQAQSEARAARTLQEYTHIRSLHGGEVTERLVSPGTLVMPGTVLLRIKETDQVRLQARLPAAQAAQLRPRASVRVSAPGKEPFTAQLSSVFGAADPATRTVTVEALINNRHARLVPGQFVEMQISLQEPRSHLTVSRSALRQDLEGQPFVFTVSSAGHEVATSYTCVMHPEVRSDKPGKCPKCGMDLVPVKSQVSGHQQHAQPTPQPAPGYTCVMHPEVRSDKPGKCPKCGMDLVPIEAKGDRVAQKVLVRPGPSSLERQAILSGLQEGQEVIVRGPEGLRSGMAVKPVPWGTRGALELPQPQAPATPAGHEGH